MSPRDRIALIILGVVALGAGAFYLFVVRGGEAPEPAPTQVASPPSTPSPEPEPEPEEPPQERERRRPPRAGFVAAGRDPFVPLVVPPGESPAGTTQAQPADPGNGGQVTNGDGDRPPDEEPKETQTIGGHRVTLIDIFTRQGEPVAQVQVDGQTYVVAEGETFAENFKLVSIQGGCANFLFGDQSFTLCEPGERK